jgi:hypothetical protein
MHLKQFNSLIKLSIFVAVFFSFDGKISCKTFKSKNKSIPSKSKNYQVLKNVQD